MWREASYFYDGAVYCQDKSTGVLKPGSSYENTANNNGHTMLNFKRYFYEQTPAKHKSNNVFKDKIQVVVYEVERAFPTFNLLQEAKIHKSKLINFFEIARKELESKYESDKRSIFGKDDKFDCNEFWKRISRPYLLNAGVDGNILTKIESVFSAQNRDNFIKSGLTNKQKHDAFNYHKFLASMFREIQLVFSKHEE